MTTVFFLIGSTGYSQKIMHSAGATISVMFAKLTTYGTTGTFTLAHTDLTYFPRYILTSGERSSFSVGIPLSAGIGLVSDRYTQGAGIYFGFDLPLVADYNFGCKSSRENEDRFGGYFGAGFGYNYTSYNVGNGGNNANSYGPLVRAGLRFALGSEEKGEEISVGVFYKKGMETEKYNTVGFNVLRDF